MKALLTLFAFISVTAHAADPKILCQFEDTLGKGTMGSSYVTEYIVKGSMASNTAMMSVTSTEYGVVKIGNQWRVNRADVRNKNNILVHNRGWVKSYKNNNPEWRTYTIQNPVNDGYIVGGALTISNKRVSDEMYSDSYKAIFALTVATDGPNYTSRVNGVCSFIK